MGEQTFEFELLICINMLNEKKIKKKILEKGAQAIYLYAAHVIHCELI